MELNAMKNYATLDELMENMNGKAVKVYSGKDDCCRCGCGGKYYYAGSKLFNAMLCLIVLRGNILKLTKSVC